MKQFLKKIISVIFVLCLILITTITASAHSGRTDSSGGHRDNKNKSGLGSYHYHCGGYPAHLHKSGYCPYRDVFPSRVTITPEKKTLRKGERVSISSSVYPANSCNTNVSWSSSDSSIVYVSNGQLVARDYGTATITAESFNGKKASVKITVKEIVAQKVVVSAVSTKADVYIGEEVQLKASIIPENVDNATIVWKSSNNNIATVSGNGLVKLLATGKVEIHATASNGVVGKTVLQVKEKYVETVNIQDDSVDLLLGEKKKITANISPLDATFPTLTWKSKNPDIASVDADGTINALACGQTSITATSTNGISDSITVNVKEIVAESITIECPKTLTIGDSTTLKFKFTPNDTTNQEIQWSVSDTSLAEINDNGELVTKGVGTISITALQKDVSAIHELVILPIKAKNIIIDSSSGETLIKGKTSLFTAIVYPSNATYSDVTWSISNPEIATIDSNGVLSALNGGVVNVIATTEDGFQVEYKLVIISPLFIALTSIGVVGIITTLILGAEHKKNKK